VKSRFSAPDVRAMVRDLRGRVIGRRVVNVYDIDSKTYLIKLAVPGESEKVVLLLESGIRFHSTKYDRDKSDMPSGFSMKLRKHIRAKRLEDVAQLGVDRVVDFRFGSGDNCNHIILEMYAGGNIILTDDKYEILALLRTHKFEENVATAVKELYPIEHATTMLSDESSGALGTGGLTARSSPAELLGWLEGQGKALLKEGDKKKARKLTLKLVLMNRGSGLAAYGSEIIHHCVLWAGLEPGRKAVSSEPLSEAEATRLVLSMEEAARLYRALDTPGQPGFIAHRGLVTLEDGTSVPKYDDVLPLALLQHQTETGQAQGGAQGGVGAEKGLSEWPSFDEAVDEYFKKVEEQKLVVAADSAESAIKQRVEKIRADQHSRLEALAQAEHKAMRKAQLLEQRFKDVDKVLLVLNSALESGVGWDALSDYVAAQQEAGNPFALMVHQLRLETSTVVVLLEDDEASSSEPAAAVELALDKSAMANAREMFAAMKAARLKKEKTEVAALRVVEVAEKQSLDALKQHHSKRELKAVRKAYWFEKFNWFITSENYLVLAGKDAQQNDLLVKKYLQTGDAYVHADLHGAASCVLRNKDPKGLTPLSPLALHEAGCMTVCRSQAWKSKMMASAWWVHAHQVSKTAPTGEYLSTGSFMIRGKKNFLASVPLEMGLAVLFKVGEEFVAHHLDERRERTLADQPENEAANPAERSCDKGRDKSSDRGSERAGPGQGKVVESVVKVEEKASKQQRREQRDLKLAQAQADAASSKDRSAQEEVQEEVQEEDQEGDQDEAESGAGQDQAAQAEDGPPQDEDGSSEGSGAGGNQENGLEESPREGAAQGLQPEGPRDEPCEAGGRSQGQDASQNTSSSSFVTPRERKLMKKRGVSLEQLRAEEAQRRADAPAAEPQQAKAAAEAEKTKAEKAKSEAAKAGSRGLAPNEVKGSKVEARESGKRGKKGKAKRVAAKYRDMDEEDLEMHRIAVGHAKLEVSDEEEGGSEAVPGTGSAEERKRREEQIQTLLRGDQSAALASLPARVASVLSSLEAQGFLGLQELDAFELRGLGALGEAQGLAAVHAFKDADLKRIGNKSGLLSGIMRRLTRDRPDPPSGEGGCGGGEGGGGEGSREGGGGEGEGDDQGLDAGKSESSRAHKRRMEAEMKKLLEEEGFMEAAPGSEGHAASAGSYVAELNQLTGLPRSTLGAADELLFAVVVCAPYASVAKYKYRCKLTPGVGKKGKAGKQALELFCRMKECTGREKDLLKMVSDNEVVQTIIGDVKVQSSRWVGIARVFIHCVN